ncbi:hypothetical protein [Roseofilum casamattae]|uniref:Diheme cytochrome C n=1 Tax=Roseofilum casamattae BLCC-M143 TaxID=3022442 RepID=A0ABT7BUR5_9CYAN|nr:hypothetical protein [Roseofilum casamattae]MDJ1182934.1 diheme cytochrome C [Roseofilum casamattae BLCC-M143]
MMRIGHKIKGIKWRSRWLVLALIFLWSMGLGWALSTLHAPANSLTFTKSVDPVPEKHQFGEELYRETCGSCHIALPPAVMPAQTWADLLQDSQHYGVNVRPLLDPGRRLVWNYMQTFSRPLLKDEATPYRLRTSRFFKALHPQVKFTEPIHPDGCISCHPSAKDFNFRPVSPEWQ